MKLGSPFPVLACLLGSSLTHGFLLPTRDFSVFDRLHFQLDRATNDAINEVSYRIRTYPEEYVLQLEVPGITSDELNLTFKEFKLFVEGEHKCDGEKERTCLPKSVNQMFYLPRDVDPDKIESSLDNGILTIRGFRNEVPRRKLTIKTGQH